MEGLVCCNQWTRTKQFLKVASYVYVTPWFGQVKKLPRNAYWCTYTVRLLQKGLIYLNLKQFCCNAIISKHISELLLHMPRTCIESQTIICCKAACHHIEPQEGLLQKHPHRLWARKREWHKGSGKGSLWWLPKKMKFLESWYLLTIIGVCKMLWRLSSWSLLALEILSDGFIYPSLLLFYI